MNFSAWPKTSEGAHRQYNALINRYRKQFQGGFSFGMDWSTFRINAPEIAERAFELNKMIYYLPNKDGIRMPR